MIFIQCRLYGTYTEDSFWTTIENQAKADGNLPESVSLMEVAKSWLGGDTYNYPVLNVIRNYGQKSADLEQVSGENTEIYHSKLLRNKLNLFSYV